MIRIHLSGCVEGKDVSFVSKLPETKKNMPGPSSILSGCGKTKSQPIDCARSIRLPAGGLSGKKIPLKQSKISSIFNDLSVSEEKNDDHDSVSKQECIVESSPQFNDSIKHGLL